MEIWKDVVGYEGMYQISDLGNVKSLTRRVVLGKNTRVLKELILKQSIDRYCYKAIMLHKPEKIKKHTIHRLLAMAFIPNPDNKPQVNHIDGNKLNNDISNLEWVTNKENMRHAVSTGLKKVTESQRKSVSKKAINIKTGKVYGSVKEAAKTLNMRYHTLLDQLRGLYNHKTDIRYYK